MEDGIMRCALFAGMRAEEIEALLGQMACTRRQYEKGEVLLHAGYENRSIGVVLHGEIEAMKLAADGTQFLTARMGPGGVFGDVLAGSHATKSPVTVAAASPVGALWLPFSALVGCGQAKLLQNYIALISDKYFALDNYFFTKSTNRENPTTQSDFSSHRNIISYCLIFKQTNHSCCNSNACRRSILINCSFWEMKMYIILRK